jgi:hypothetical protein
MQGIKIEIYIIKRIIISANLTISPFYAPVNSDYDTEIMSIKPLFYRSTVKVER